MLSRALYAMCFYVPPCWIKVLRDNDVQHTLTAAGHPATNGLAECYAGEFKDKLSKIGDTGKSVQAKLDRFMLTY